MLFLGIAFVLFFVFAMPVDAKAAFRLASVFTENLVLQRDLEVPVWGRGEPGTSVTVQLDGHLAETTVDDGARWRLALPPMSAGGPHTLIVRHGETTVTLGNVLVGDVWVCSGQSNMEWPVAASLNAADEVASATDSGIRLLTVPHRLEAEPVEEQPNGWVECRPQTVGGFSAVGYFFARELRRELEVPIGLINSSVGGSAIEAWMSRELLASDPDYAPIVESYARAVEAYRVQREAYEKAMENWHRAARDERANGGEVPVPPAEPPNPEAAVNRPSALYNGMIAPLLPYGIRGVLWYQGESNASPGRTELYRKEFQAMIHDWRERWGEGDFAFLFVQLANWLEPPTEPTEDAWAELREAQASALALPNTAMAVAIDIGDAEDIHPKNKQEVGRRLALAFLGAIEGREIVYSGPVYDGFELEGNRARIRFRHVGGGLVAKDGGPLTGFAIAGEDRRFRWAEARIDGDTVLVWSDEVAHPVAVRYAWAANPAVSLYNRDGLPAPPFRTDDWPFLP